MSAELRRRIEPVETTDPTQIETINTKGNPVPLTLYDALSIGYERDVNKQQDELNRFGFNVDESLSNHDHLTAYNPDTKKLLYVVNGTQTTRPQDLYTDASLLFGRLKQTSRYKSDKRDYDKAKLKYDNNNIVIAGHSLGSNIGSKLDTNNKNVNVYSFNGASTFGEKKNEREKSFRTSNDLVSLLKVNSKIVKQNVSGLPVLAPHELSNLKGQQLFI
jgi:hypothetical protein